MFAGGWQVSSILYTLGILAAINILIISLMRVSGNATQNGSEATSQALASR